MKRVAAILLVLAGCAGPPSAGEGPGVEGTYACEALGRLPSDVTVKAFRASDGARVRDSSWGTGRFRLSLAPGEYRLLFHGTEIRQQVVPVTVPPGAGRTDLGTVSLEPSTLALSYGIEPPAWTVGEARGLPRGAELADLRGRWVILAFWAYW